MLFRSRNLYSPDGSALLGHFGTFGPTVREPVVEVLASGFAKPPNHDVLLIGPGSEDAAADVLRRRPDLIGRIHATGRIPATQVAECIAACDVMFQPYPDGVSSRRGSFMAALALGRPTVTTLGVQSEAFWKETGAAVFGDPSDTAGLAAAVARLLGNPAEREKLGVAARSLYARRFDISHTIDALHNS